MSDRKDSIVADNAVVLITAAAAGIGRSIAESFLADGYRVHICDLDEDALAEFQAAHPSASVSVCDVSSVDAVAALFDDVRRCYGDRLDVLVNNAGIAGPVANLEQIDPVDWERTLAVDLNSVFYCCRQAIPLLKKSAGCIINMSSTAGLYGFAGRAPYVASKWAIIGLTKTLAKELGPFGVRANAVCPGSVAGDRIDRVIEKEAERLNMTATRVREAFEAECSLGRFVQPQEVANTVLFLATPGAAAISGQVIPVDGNTE